MAAYSLLAEGYTADFESMDEDRMVMLKTKEWVKAVDIVPTITHPEAIAAIRFYQRYRRMGMPYGSWALNPEKLVEVVDILEPLDRFYHPQVTI